MAWFVGGGDVANEEHLAQLKKGVNAWNRWRNANPKVGPDLSGADLRLAELRETNLRGTNLRGANLAGTNLNAANLSEADLRSAFLFSANLADARFSGANLSGASLSSADLTGADLCSAHLYSADLGTAKLSGARMGYTVFANNDLSTTKGLDMVRHIAGSTIGIDTIYKSQGKIPLAFLRGCGVPENFITYMSSLTGSAFEFYSCFISYSTKDQEFAERLYGDLQNKGVRCWYAPHDIQGGKFIDEQIDAAIRLHEKVLLILSPNSVHSDWVQVEVGKAREREAKEGKRVLFPVRLVGHEEVLAALRDWALYHGKEGKDAAGEIRRFYVPDFSRWKEHDLYKKEF
jgi:uncharacterized protein YjbI with pentapeptide repeats